MRGIHPKFARRALAWLALVAGAAGCQGRHQTASINPFLTPNRVPAPATRTIMPGTAQPYYPGDPLPAMQSATDRPGLAVPVENPEAEQVAGAGPAVTSTKGTTLAYSKERTVTIPADNDALRFEPQSQPALLSQSPLPAAPAPPAVANHGALGEGARQPQSFVPAQPAEPISALPPESAASFNPPTGPWRPPQVSSRSMAMAAPPRGVVPASYTNSPGSPWGEPPKDAPLSVAGAAIENSSATMGVRLRAVPSPERAGSGAPRIRIPTYVPATQTFVMPDGSIQEVTYMPVMTQPTAGVQTLGVTPLAAAENAAGPIVGEASTPLAATAPFGPSQSIASGDGFRPRGSAR